MPMYIDSGADISMIPFHFGRAFGFTEEELDAILEIKGISGAGIPYILKKVGLLDVAQRRTMDVPQRRSFEETKRH